MSAITSSQHRTVWIRDARFDFWFIVGVAVLAAASGWIVVQNPSWFVYVLILDLWVLGYHHVVATFTRLAFDRESFDEHRFLAIGLPIIVLSLTMVLGKWLGIWAITTLYLYWQWFHYTRQSYGIFRIYSRKAEQFYRADTWVLYAIPLWGILWRSYQSPDEFLSMPVWTIPIPWLIVVATGAASLALFIYWSWRQYQTWQDGRLSLPLLLYMLSHVAIFSIGYVLIDHMDYGWLVINVWHNAQYILLVWTYNNNRFRDGPDPRHWLLSVLSQTKNVASYFLFCLAISTGAYALIAFSFPSISEETNRMPLLSTLIIYQAINFHHYLVDGVIWKIRKKKVQAKFNIPHTAPTE